jgi:diguanylate cyclase (GGDEF)-like protein
MGGDPATPGRRWFPASVRRRARSATRCLGARLTAAVAGSRLSAVPRPSLLRFTMICTAVSVAWFLLRLVWPFGPTVLGWLPVPIVPLLSVVATVRVATSPGLARPARRVWGGLAVSSAAVLLCVFTLMYDTLLGPGAPTQRPGPASNALFLIAMLVALWGVIRLPVRERSRHEWFTVGLDIGIVLVATGLILWYGSTWSAAGTKPWWLLMIVFTILGMLVAIKVSLTGFTGIDHASMRVLAGAVLLGTLAGSTLPLLAGRPDLNNVMLTIPIAVGGVAYAAEVQRRASQRRTRPTIRQRRPLPFSLLPYASVACTDAILLTVSDHTPDAIRVMIVGSVAITGLVIARQMIAFQDNRRYQDQLGHQASHDDLTGLANRLLLRAHSEAAVRAGPPGTVAVAVVDLDDFKTVNDRLGHGVGDALLVAVSARLRECVRPGDTVARLGGDEFAILLTDLRPGDSSAVAERALAALTRPVSAEGHQLLIQASIGLAENTADSEAGDLLRRADLAMYAAKEDGKNRYAHYDAELEARTEEHAQIAAELSVALERDELHMLYQPIIDLNTGAVMGVEALVRWRHPRDGMVSPVRFIPVAERTGLIVPIGAWVLRTACEQAADWQYRLGDRAPSRITVNVSARQLLDPDFARLVADVLLDTGLNPARLTMEITETAVFGGGRALETVGAVHALGVSVALDDFGTGHSSLGLLRSCPVDVLKVDKSFVDGVPGTPRQEAIAISIIGIADALGLRAIAEGVETAAQAERLHDMGYQFAQGFHFARPLPAAEVETMLPAEGRVPAGQGRTWS